MKKRLISLICIFFIILVGVLIYVFWLNPVVIQPNIAYRNAEALLASGQYQEASKSFEALGAFKNSAEMANEARYQEAESLMKTGNYTEAVRLFTELDTYRDSIEKSDEANYLQANSLLNQGDYDAAHSLFQSISQYKDSAELSKECTYQQALKLFSNKKFTQAIDIFKSISTYKDSSAKISECTYSYAKELMQQKNYESACLHFDSLGNYEDSNALANECRYKWASEKMFNDDYTRALALFNDLGDYKDSNDLAIKCTYEMAMDKIKNGAYDAAKDLLCSIPDYKDANHYIALLDEAVNYVYWDDSSFYLAEYMWVVTEIDTVRGTSSLAVCVATEEVGSNSYLTEIGTAGAAQRQWKIENGLIYISSKGKDPTPSQGLYRTWVISDDWSSIYERTFEYSGAVFGDGEYDVNWVRLSDDEASEIKKAIATFYKSKPELSNNTDWSPFVPLMSKDKPVSSDTPNTVYENNNQKKCVTCGRTADYSYKNPFSNKVEPYCFTHYNEILDMMGSFESDVGASIYSNHTCEQCSREGTHVYHSFTGNVEYYCTKHYEELQDLLNQFGLD